MFRILLILFLTVPVLEIVLLFQVADVIGGWWTVLLIIVTAVLGANLLRQQGLVTVHRLQTCMQQGELPAQALIEGMLLLLAGAFLLTPGFVTDTAGFLLLALPIRSALAAQLLRNGVFSTQVKTSYSSTQSSYEADGRTIEGEYRRRDD